MKKNLYQTNSSRIMSFYPLDRMTITVHQSKDLMTENWNPATISYPSSMISPDEIIVFANALKVAARLAKKWTAERITPAPAREEG